MLFEYMQTRVYYSPYTGTRTRTRINVNPAIRRALPDSLFSYNTDRLCHASSVINMGHICLCSL